MTTRGEMTLEQPAVDTLKVILSGDWLLGGDLPKAETVQQRLKTTPRYAAWSSTAKNWGAGTPAC